MECSFIKRKYLDISTKVENSEHLMELEVNLDYTHKLSDVTWDDDLENEESEKFKKAAEEYVDKVTPILSGKFLFPNTGGILIFFVKKKQISFF